MKFGLLFLSDYHPDAYGDPSRYYGYILEQVELAEQLGFWSVWFGEHHAGGYAFGAPSVIATAAASRTRRIRLGTGVSLIPLNNPIRLAEEYAMLDVISGGRLEYAIGRGVLKYDYDIMNLEESESQARYREGTELIIKAWTSSDPFSHQGRFWKLTDYLLFPPPVQKPHPPIFASAALTPESYAWAGAMGLNLCTAFFFPMPPGQVRANIDLYRKELARNGFDIGQRSVSGVYHAYCGADPREAHATGEALVNRYFTFTGRLERRGGLHYAADYEQYHGSLATFFKGKTFDDLDRERLFMIGDPERLIERIRWVEQYYGADYLLLAPFQGGIAPDLCARSLERFAKYVMPVFADPPARASNTQPGGGGPK
jgi:alkanesulfonate monooxygenase SsuD/methylene tetrahydromethanopterin reductase-like flavin-dependent oxidoreductase (luciferase family)